MLNDTHKATFAEMAAAKMGMLRVVTGQNKVVLVDVTSWSTVGGVAYTTWGARYYVRGKQRADLTMRPGDGELTIDLLEAWMTKHCKGK